MKAQHLLLVLPVVEAFFASAPLTSFVVRPNGSMTQGRSRTILNDMEGDVDVATREQIANFFQQTSIVAPRMTVEEAESAHGMPWRRSIDAALPEDALLYMPFWEWQLSFMKENLTNLRAIPCTAESNDYSYEENTKKKARIVSACFASSEYRKIRMTYYDAGDNCQVFNSVWYPNPKYNLPILGIDLLSFNRKKYLAIVDFQPIHTNEDDHALAFENRLEPIKEKYESLKGRMSSKFYDETQFFSQQMLFARFENEAVISDDLFPAFRDYVQTHLDMVRDTPLSVDASSAMQSVLELQQAYDTYSAERDPATGLFASMFGKEWADGFVYDFLFSLAEKREGGAPVQVSNVSRQPQPGGQ
jgi:15,16-dihydrobiliverdin:ferredoxin oxidoreductase